MTNLSDIIEILEKAEAGSRELDAHIAAALDIRPDWLATQKGRLVCAEGTLRWQYDGRRGTSMSGLPSVECDPFTTSVDAAISLAESFLPGANRTIRKRYRTTAGKIDGHTYDAHVSGGDICEGKTEALALCLAILKAKAQQQEGGE